MPDSTRLCTRDPAVVCTNAGRYWAWLRSSLGHRGESRLRTAFRVELQAHRECREETSSNDATCHTKTSSFKRSTRERRATDT